MALTCCNTPEAAYPRPPAPHGGPFAGRIGGIPTHRCPERITPVTPRRSGPAISSSTTDASPPLPPQPPTFVSTAAAYLRLHRSRLPSSPPQPPASARRSAHSWASSRACSPRAVATPARRVEPAGRDGTGPGRAVTALAPGQAGRGRAETGPDRAENRPGRGGLSWGQAEPGLDRAGLDWSLGWNGMDGSHTPPPPPTAHHSSRFSRIVSPRVPSATVTQPTTAEIYRSTEENPSFPDRFSSVER
jgi:hypothetical protein